MNKESILHILRSKTFAVVVSAAVSSTGSVLVTRHILRKRYDEIGNQEVQEAKEHYERLYKEGPFSDPTELAKEYLEPELDKTEVELPAVFTDRDRRDMTDILQKTNYQQMSKDKPEVVVLEQEQAEVLEVKESIAQNVFETYGGVSGLNVEAESNKRSQGLPYIVDQTTAYENPENYDLLQWTYYAGDETLADEEDRRVDNVRDSVGEGNLQFGAGTDEPSIVFVANDRRSQLYEISLSDGKYSEEVAGFIEHSDSGPGVRKFRKYWDD